METKLALQTSAPVLAGLLTVGVVDRDGDLILPNANVHTGTAVVSDWDHSFVFQGREPVGKARVVEIGDRVFAEVEYDDTPQGKRACERVARERPDWSPGFNLVETRAPTTEEAALGAKRVIVKWSIEEVSPATKGASVSSGTHHACCSACETGSGKCLDELKAELATIEDAKALRSLASHIGSLLRNSAPPDKADAPTTEAKAALPDAPPAPAADAQKAPEAPGYIVEALRERLARINANKSAGAAA
jgi:hypothetical protein